MKPGWIVLIIFLVLAVVGGIVAAILLTRKSDTTETTGTGNGGTDNGGTGNGGSGNGGTGNGNGGTDNGGSGNGGSGNGGSGNGGSTIMRTYRGTSSERDIVPFVFTVNNSVATMDGEITSDIDIVLRKMLDENPQLRTINMVNVPGSNDDDANIRAGLLLRSKMISTHLPAGSLIASGGVDFFLAGSSRTVEFPVMIGVHSWEGDGFEGRDIRGDRSHPEHQKYLDYYRSINIDPEFYFFTLQTPAAEIYYMTMNDIARFNIIT